MNPDRDYIIHANPVGVLQTQNLEQEAWNLKPGTRNRSARGTFKVSASMRAGTLKGCASALNRQTRNTKPETTA